MGEVKKALCQWCHARCRVLVKVDNGRLVSIEEDPSDPRVDGISPPTRACPRLNAARDWFYHPERVNFPLKRAGEKGENKWQRITWDQAFDEIAARLGDIRAGYGAEALMITGGTGRTDEWDKGRFAYLFGTPNLVGQAHICFTPCVQVAAALYGWSVRHRTGIYIDAADAKLPTKCALMIGIEPSQAYPRLWKSMKQARNLGIKLIVIDPRRTPTTELADIWLQIRPGTDTALLMSMINVIIEEGLYDREFVDRWCYGFDKLAEHAKGYSPERTAEITLVPAEKVREAARVYAANRPGVTMNGMGMEHLEDVTEAIQARYILPALVGNIDVEGGDYMPGPAKDFVTDAEMELSDHLPAEQRRKQLGADRFKLLAWPGRELIQHNVKRLWGKEHHGSFFAAFAHYPTVLRAIITGKPYPVKAGITVSSNPMITQANVKVVHKALKSLELYVVSDFWLTPSAQLADYVLPAACWLERVRLVSLYGTDCNILAGEPALPPSMPGKYEHKSDYEFWRGLGLRLGQEEYWPWKNLEEVADYRLQARGISFKDFMAEGGLDFPAREFKKYEKMGGFSTPTGKIELYSTIFEKLGYDPLPRYQEPHETPVSNPELATEYPLMLITGGRFHPYFHSEWRQVDALRKRRPHPQVQIHPDTATKLGIKSGDWVWIETPRGRIKQRCTTFDGIDPGVVHAEHGWWFPEESGGEPSLHGAWESNINVVTDDDPDRCNKLSGGWPLKTALCRIYKVGDMDVRS